MTTMWRRLFVLLLCWACARTAQAQTLTDAVAAPEAFNWISYGLKMLSMAIAVGGPALSPYVTRKLVMVSLMAFEKYHIEVPDKVLIFISSVMSGVFAGIVSAYSDAPMHGDTGAGAGALIGAASQKMANTARIDITPSPAAMAVKLDEQKKDPS